MGLAEPPLGGLCGTADVGFGEPSRLYPSRREAKNRALLLATAWPLSLYRFRVSRRLPDTAFSLTLTYSLVIPQHSLSGERGFCKKQKTLSAFYIYFHSQSHHAH